MDMSATTLNPRGCTMSERRKVARRQHMTLHGQMRGVGQVLRSLGRLMLRAIVEDLRNLVARLRRKLKR